MAVAPWIVSDELWELVEPLLPVKERRFRYPGRKRLPERQALQGILFVLQTGISWTHLPAELGFGSGVTCWRRLESGRRLECGSVCTSYCSLGCGLRGSSSGHEPWSMPAMCRRKGGLRDGPEPG
jgi:transposase